MLLACHCSICYIIIRLFTVVYFALSANRKGTPVCIHSASGHIESATPPSDGICTRSIGVQLELSLVCVLACVFVFHTLYDSNIIIPP